jgi:hypothetical protein
VYQLAFRSNRANARRGPGRGPDFAGRARGARGSDSHGGSRELGRFPEARPGAPRPGFGMHAGVPMVATGGAVHGIGMQGPPRGGLIGPAAPQMHAEPPRGRILLSCSVDLSTPLYAYRSYVYLPIRGPSAVPGRARGSRL